MGGEDSRRGRVRERERGGRWGLVVLVESIEECEVAIFPAWHQELPVPQGKISPTVFIQLVLITRAPLLSFSRRASCALTRHCVLFLPIKEIIAGCSQAPPRQ